MNQEIHTHLETLRKELAKLAPAVTHIERAGEITTSVVQAARKIQVDYETHLANLEAGLLELHRNNYEVIATQIDNAVERVNNATAEIKEVQANRDQSVSSLVDKYQTLMSATDTLVQEIKKIDFPERLSGLSFMTEAVSQDVKKIAEGTLRANSNFSALSTSLIDQLQTLTTKIELMELPMRLSKLDSLTRKINHSMQNMENQFGSVQQQLREVGLLKQIVIEVKSQNGWLKSTCLISMLLTLGVLGLVLSDFLTG